jgi:hypothetical protein
MILKAKCRNWHFEKFSCKNGFSLFFSTKNWEIVQFHLGKTFCSVKFRQDSLIFPNSTGLEHSKLIISSGGGIVR